MIATANNTSVFELDGVRVYAGRVGDRVTGRAEFPSESYGRTEIAMNNRLVRPDESTKWARW